MPYPIIDLFAGPGGLAEGFSSLTDAEGDRLFDIRLSIEKDAQAHRTLLLRSFVRQFPFGRLPEDYYLFFSGEISLETLYKRYPDAYRSASQEAWQATLGLTPVEEIDNRIELALDGRRDWVLIGGPPCQAYSNVGRSRVGGIDENDHRVYLYREYLRIIARHHPAVFVMENVEGLLSAKVNGEKVFEWMLRDLCAPGSVFPEDDAPEYRIHSLVREGVLKDSDYLIRAEDYGLPQKRHRVILLGVRHDIGLQPGVLQPSDRISLESIIGMFPVLRSGITRSFTHSETVFSENSLPRKKRYYQRIENSVDNWRNLTEGFRSEISEKLDMDDLGLPVSPQSMGDDYRQSDALLIEPTHSLAGWFTDRRLDGIRHHESRGHLLEDLKRYLFAALYSRRNGRFPKLQDYHRFDAGLLPDHDNVSSGKFTDRFRVQLPHIPATTVTSHISKDGHYFIHYDHWQCRSLTVREAARIQTFPDNYVFCGKRTDQFHQVGNAVPPYLAFQIAEVVGDLLLRYDNVVRQAGPAELENIDL
ncbi:MAG: DNA cytosine methyltransferase [Chryseobacterium sp.]|nr:MAG: DNA cytosine methyltransferase [Chryseobacterium sp.]